MHIRFLIALFVLFAFSATAVPDKHILSALLESKSAANVNTAVVKKGWYEDRLITPGTHFYIKKNNEFVLHQHASDPFALKQYAAKLGTQGLVHAPGVSMGASVDTAIRATTLRTSEKDRTFVQYDKDQIQQDKKDFKVDAKAVNTKNQLSNKTNYEGGHLVDYQFSGAGSHMDAANYVPQHYYYNRFLKQNLVSKVDGFIEIPLFTQNPPKIKVLGVNRYDPIPIGILLVPMKDKKILDMYYFPNNQYNYRTSQSNCGLTAGKMPTPFKLKPELQQLLWPAIIYELQGAGLVEQQAKESLRAGVIDELIEGMSCAEYDDAEEVIPSLASDVVHKKDVTLSHMLNADDDTIAKLKNGQANVKALQKSFNALGHFLVEYAIKNALKSELISTNSRIMFANIITDFIECHHQVHPRAVSYIDDTYDETYDDVMTELWRIRKSMDMQDLIFFANVHQKLSSPFIHDSFLQGFNLVENMDLEDHVETLIELLQLIYKKAKKETLTCQQQQNVVELFIEAQNNLAYVICLGQSPEEFEEQIAFMAKAKAKVQAWSDASNATSGSYITSPNSATSFKKMENFNDYGIQYLGSCSSMSYQNAEVDEN